MFKILSGVVSIIALAVGMQFTVPSPGPGTANPHGGGAVPTFVNYADGENAATNTTIATSSPIALTAGNFGVVCVGYGGNSVTVSGVTDGTNTYVFLARAGDNSVGRVEMWYKENLAAVASATITATYSATIPFRTIEAASYSGVLTASSADQNSCNPAGCSSSDASTVNRSATNVTTTQASELLVACSYDGNGHTWAVANSFNARGGLGSRDYNLLDKTVSSTGSYPGGNYATAGTAQAYVAMFGTFKGQ